jgi:hypothetical protein
MTLDAALSCLPLDIQAILKRKSSRDPSSRFSSKLWAILSHVARFPSFEQNLGVGWAEDDVFKLHKRTLASLLDIKLNTLNVDLRDLGFKQQQHDKDGWTHWKHDGFTRNASSCPDDPPLPMMTILRPIAPIPTLFDLGPCSKLMLEQFFQQTSLMWRELSGSSTMPVESSWFVRRAAERFRQETQPIQNAIDVLTAIIASTPDGSTTYDHFARLMAMFGPEKSLMLKIASLLESSQKSGQWLYFNTEQPHFLTTYGSFDRDTPNCLVLRKYDTVSRIWNFPTVEQAPGTQYLMDDLGQMYASWAGYFAMHPVRQQPYGGFA